MYIYICIYVLYKNPMTASRQNSNQIFENLGSQRY